MVLCPVALAVGCKKCPVVGVCPAKNLIGDYKPDPEMTQPLPAGNKAKKKGRK